MMLSVSQIAVFPVKSLGAMYPLETELERTGFRHDRAWMIVDEDGIFVTQRQFPWMACIGTDVTEAGVRLLFPDGEALEVPVIADGTTLRVHVWNSECKAVDQGDAAADALSDFIGRPCRLVRMHQSFSRRTASAYTERAPKMSVGFADSSPLMLLSEASLEDLNRRLETPVAMSRFRPNLVIAGGEAFQEDRWTRIRIGKVTLSLVKDCIRCEIPTVDQETGEKGVEPMETLESYRAGPLGPRFGRKVVQETLGTIRVGDPVTVIA